MTNRITALRALEKAVVAGEVGQYRNLDSALGHMNGVDGIGFYLEG